MATSPEFVWVPGVKYDDCLCTECHDDVCRTRPIKAKATYKHVPQSWRCRLFGHRPDTFFSGERVPCERNCGYVRVFTRYPRPIPTARLIRS